MSKTVDLGPVSAYALAVKHGYTGTEEEWVAEMEAKRLEAVTAASEAKSAAAAASQSQTASANSATAASNSATASGNSATAASGSATLSESYAHGGTGTRDGEDTDNAKYYMEQAKAVSAVDIATTEKAGIVKPDGTTITVDPDGTIRGSSSVDLSGYYNNANYDTNKNVLQLMHDDTVLKELEISGGGTKIAPKDTVDPAILNGNAKVTISWGDPEDVIIDGIVLSAWKGTKLVMKDSGYPENENDGTLILDNTVRDAYKASGYVVDGLTNGNTYYFALFPYSTDGVYNYSESNRLLGNPSLVKLDSCTNMQISAAMGSVTVSWDDPEATKTVGDITAIWAKTVLVYKQGSVAPNSPADGTIAVTETRRNQYASVGYEVTGLTDGKQYTFALFAISTDETPSDAVSATAKLWATLTVNTTEDTLFGKTVTATNEVKTVSGTFSDSGSATLQIPWIGSTTVSSTDGTDTADGPVDITAYMASYSVDITLTPVGETVTPVNDITILLKCAGIKDRTYATMSELLAANDTDAMLDITMSDNAMQYLARSTDFADEVCANENFMAYLGQSPSVDDTVLNSDLWKQKIKASQYWSLVYASKTVTVYGGAYETITIDGYYGSFTTNADGSVSHVVPIDTITLTGSVSGQSFTRTVTSDTTKVYVMPEGALYWYGNECTWITGGWNSFQPQTYSMGTVVKNINNITISYNSSSGSAAICSNNKNNLSDFTKLSTHIVDTNIEFGRLGISDTQNFASTNFAYEECIHGDWISNETIAADISSYNDSYYVYLGGWNANSSGTESITIDEILLR